MSRALRSPALVLVLVLASSFVTPSNAHIGSPLSAVAPTPPTIDGLLSPGEWDGAAQASVFSGTFSNSTFYVMNDANNLYLALRVVDPTLDPNDIMHVRFDNAHNSVHNTGDDAVSIRPGDFDDLHFVLTQSGFGSFANLDLQQDGSGAAGDEGITNFFEASHPLSSGDPDDFSLLFGNTIGFCLAYFKEGTAVSGSMHPLDCLAADVELGVNEQTLYGDIVIATPKPVTVTIIRFIQDQNPDPAPDTTGEFYARVSIGGLPFQDNRESALNATDISPFWTFTQQVDASLGTVPIEFQILDVDLLDPDDVMDISPGNQTSATLSLDLNTCTWTGASGPNVGFSQGTSGRILFDVGCTGNGDIDLDGIPDGVERFGALDGNGDIVGYAGSFTPALQGADPCRPTVAVEIDYMEVANDHTHRPDPLAIAAVVAAFDDAPVSAILQSSCPYAGFPTQNAGIGLIVQVDDAIAEETLELAEMGDDFDTLRDRHFDFALAPYFHYSLWVHSLATDSTTSGIGELHGNEFVVSLGGWQGTIEEQAGTFMHELGHNLGLDHGGDEEVNFKPNYVSVMSYTYQVTGIKTAAAGTRFDFSHEILPSLHEAALTEANGIGDGTDIAAWFCPGELAPAAPSGAGPGNGALDWNCSNGPPDTDTVSVDINGDGLTNSLRGFDDWSSIDYTFRADPVDFDPGKSALPKGKSALPKGRELTREQAQIIQVFWQAVSFRLVQDPPEPGESILVSRSLQVNKYFTNTKLNPITSVDIVLKKGFVKSTNPGEVIAWAEVSNTLGVPLLSLKLTETLPKDWSAHPSSDPVEGAIHVFFQLANGTRIEITDFASIDLTTNNPQEVMLSIGDISATAAGRPLGPGESILLSVKMVYALKGTMPQPGDILTTYADTVTATTFSGLSLQGYRFSGSASASFTAFVKDS